MDRLLGRRGARRVLHADSDEEEPAGHAAHRSSRHPIARERLTATVFRETTTHRRALSRDDARVPRPRDRSTVTTPLGAGPLQGGAPERRITERRAGVRRLRPAGGRAPAGPSRTCRRCHEGVPRLDASGTDERRSTSRRRSTTSTPSPISATPTRRCWPMPSRGRGACSATTCSS